MTDTYLQSLTSFKTLLQIVYQEQINTFVGTPCTAKGFIHLGLMFTGTSAQRTCL